jgi:hypothetical protein
MIVPTQVTEPYSVYLAAKLKEGILSAELGEGSRPSPEGEADPRPKDYGFFAHRNPLLKFRYDGES